MTLTTERILQWAKESKHEDFNVACFFLGVAAQCATEISNELHTLKNYRDFTEGTKYTHLEIPFAYYMSELEEACIKKAAWHQLANDFECIIEKHELIDDLEGLLNGCKRDILAVRVEEIMDRYFAK